MAKLAHIGVRGTWFTVVQLNPAEAIALSEGKAITQQAFDHQVVVVEVDGGQTLSLTTLLAMYDGEVNHRG